MSFAVAWQAPTNSTECTVGMFTPLPAPMSFAVAFPTPTNSKGCTVRMLTTIPTPMSYAVAFPTPTLSKGCTVGMLTIISLFAVPSTKLFFIISQIIWVKMLLPILKHFSTICLDIFIACFPSGICLYIFLLPGLVLYRCSENVAIV